MDTMRWLWMPSLALGLLSAALGCHTAGKCDCDTCEYGCCSYGLCCGDHSTNGGEHVAPIPAATSTYHGNVMQNGIIYQGAPIQGGTVVQPEQIKEMPKGK